MSPGALKVGYNSPQDPLIVSEVLRKRLDQPIEVMIFDSCNMASIEVAYEFKDLVSVMVASQDLMDYSFETVEGNTYSSRPGIDYIDLVLKLKPNSNPITIGTFDRPFSSVIQSYSNSYVKKASGLSILFFKDLSRVSLVRKSYLKNIPNQNLLKRPVGIS